MSHTRHLAITGTDGTGKTTVIRLLQQHFAEAPHRVRAFRAPQYHEDPDLPFQRLSEAIERLGQLADVRGDLGLKASALFLSMTLFGEVEQHVDRAWAPEWVVTERQCLADSLVYARFYQPVLQADLDESALRGPIVEALGEQALSSLERWTHALPRRLGRPAGLRLWDLPSFMLELFAAPAPELLPTLAALYQSRLPDRLLVLTASEEVLAERLHAKHQTATPRELHEQAHIIAMFQQGLRGAAQGLQLLRPDLQVDELDTSTWSPEETVAWIAERLEGAWAGERP